MSPNTNQRQLLRWQRNLGCHQPGRETRLNRLAHASRGFGFLLALFLILFTNQIFAGMITLTPSDLAPGDPYRLVFVTSQTRDATSTLLSTYNNFVTSVVQTNPELAGLATTWRAIAATTSSGQRNIQLNTGTEFSAPGPTGVPIYTLDGVRIANDYDDLWDGFIAHTLAIDEFGRSVNELDANGRAISGVEVWTGALVSGSLGSERPFYGNTLFTNGGWIQEGVGNLNPSNILERAFYGISDILSVSEPMLASQQFVLDVTYTDPAIVSGPLSYGLSELPESVEAQFQ